MTYNNDDFNLMDKISNHIYINLYSLSKTLKKIVFKNIDFKNKKHLTVLNIAYAVSSLTGFDIYVTEAKILDLFLYNRKRKNKIRKTKDTCGYIDIDSLINFTCKDFQNGELYIEAIYDNYYNKGDKNDL